MSRCFPFPPPGYMRNGACSEDLIKSIKLQKERDEAKEQRKKDKRKKKEERDEAKEQRKQDKRKKKERTEDRKERKEKEAKATHSCGDKGKESKLKMVESYQLKKIGVEHGSGCLLKGGDDDSEQLERSGITEEHDQPFSSTEPCCLSDSTQSSNKRKRSTSPSSNDHGTTIKIRLPLRKQREHEESQEDHQAAGPTERIGKSKSLTQEPHHQYQGLGNSTSNSDHIKEYQDLARAGVDPSTTSIDSESQRMASLYSSLFQNWNFYPLQFKGTELEDQEWLSTSKRQEQTQAPKKVNSVNDASRCSSSTLWPSSQFLPEADIYALPYTVPY